MTCGMSTRATAQLECGADPNGGIPKGFFPSGPLLGVAASKGQAEIAALLLRCGAKVNARDQYGMTALHYAAARGHYELVRLLQEPTGPMKTEAAEAGFYQPPGLLPAVPRVQILTIEELLAGRTLEYPKIEVATFKKAPRREKGKRQEE